ncbi:SH3 domain-containing C40 family peptidase [Paenibacillus urinalis]|uniref:SH3 domain-containing C40 family peptidase n=1 Tax=Paenibacillus urinalis TaxID=521520 RepID=A0ABY7X326_9BACL|nr:SH3 domain-containing C40 family peptidase [Paenibacillus urinalis]WDH96601.1 SH3 domain-containing C40 family peptidase [Paenibacillus urinalis]WDI00247.1 SH3 domain-containing C40 family peptidase [Paenibacillus urinalis]
MKVTKMILSGAVASALLFGSVSLPVFTSQSYAAATTKEVLYGVNLRETASTSSSVIRLLKKGETVTLLGTSGSNWIKVKDTKGNTGYISSSSKYTQTVNGSSSSSNESSSSESSVSTNTSSTVEKVISAGMKYLGTPYEYGASRSSTNTFDCSSFVRQAFIDGAGITLPSDSRKQGAYVKNKGNAKSSISSLKRGDLMFFMSYKGTSKSAYSGINKSSATITHVGIYLGDGKILQTYSAESGGVRVDSIEGKHWEYRFLFGGSAL